MLLIALGILSVLFLAVEFNRARFSDDTLKLVRAGLVLAFIAIVASAGGGGFPWGPEQPG